MTISLLLFAFIAYGNGSIGQTFYFSFLAILAFLFMPLYTRWSYRKTYLKHVRNFYKGRMSEPTTLSTTEKGFEISDSQGESFVEFSELDEINELKDYCFLKVKSGQSIIIPIRKIDFDVKSELIEISKKHAINWNDQTTWIWK
jgi:hypothetical protein